MCLWRLLKSKNFIKRPLESQKSRESEDMKGYRIGYLIREIEFWELMGRLVLVAFLVEIMDRVLYDQKLLWIPFLLVLLWCVLPIFKFKKED